MKIKIKPLEPNQLQFLGAGDFYIGDPCYVFPDEDWGNFVDEFYSSGQGNKPVRAVFIDDKFSFIVSNTAYGDGEYPVFLGLEYQKYFCVDAGLWSIIPMNNNFGAAIKSRDGVVCRKLDFNGAIWSEPHAGDFWIELFDGREIKIFTSGEEDDFV